MFCAECGAKVPEGARFCANCGKPVVGKPAAEKEAAERAAAEKAAAEKAAAEKAAVERAAAEKAAAEKAATEKAATEKAAAEKPAAINSEKKAEEKNPTAGKAVPETPEAGKINKKPKGKPKKKKWFVVGIGAAAVAVVLVLLLKGGGRSGSSGTSGFRAADEMAEMQEWDVEIKNDAQAAYYHDFVNLIPFGEDVPYISIQGDGLYPDVRYNWLTMSKYNFDDEYPYGKLRDAYSYVLSDIYVLNDRPEKELEMAQYFYCNNSISTLSGVSLDVETQNEYDGLLWYMTFLNYQCDIETEEDEYGTLVHVKISNTDMVKLLYEELENTYNMVKEDNEQAAAERLNGAFDQVKTYFRNEADNVSRLDHLNVTWTGGIITDVTPVYGNSLVSKLNLVELAGGLIFEQAKYQMNRQFWGNLSDDGTLYHYTLSNMLLRMAKGDCDIINTELTFYAEVDSRGNGYIPFDTRTNYTSFVKADENWESPVEILQSKGLAASNCSVDNIQQGDPFFTWGLSGVHDYEHMLLWVIMGWRGSIVDGKSVTERTKTLGYVGKVEPVTADTGMESTAPREVIEGKSVFADPDSATGLYEVDGVLYEINGGEAKAVGTVEGFNLTELTLPKEINDCPLTVLGECAIFECDSLVSIAVPEGVRILEKNALAGNYNLVSISLPSTLTEIGIGAFITDVSLKEINIPDGVTVIEQGTFLSCYSLEELTLPDSVETIGYGAFDACESLHIWVPKTAKCGQYAFRQVAEVNYR